MAPRLTAPDRRALEALIEEALNKELLRGFGESRVSVALAGDRGASGASTFAATAKVHFFVKQNVDPEQARAERDGYDLLQDDAAPKFRERLVPPIIPSSGYPVMLFPQLGGGYYETLHDWVSGSASQERKLTLYRAILESFLNDLWIPSASPEPADLKKIYRARSHERAKSLVRLLGSDVDYRKLTIQINGSGMGRLGDYIDVVDEFCASAIVTPSCTIHGDEHPRNIMVDPQDDWVVVDYASARRKADWVYSLAKALHWWRVYYCLDNARRDGDLLSDLDAKVRLSPDKKTLHLRYNEGAHRQALTPICALFENQVRDVGKQASSHFDDPQWQSRLSLAYFAVVLGNTTALLKDRPKKNRFVVPAMLHSALRGLNGGSLFEPGDSDP